MGIVILVLILLILYYYWYIYPQFYEHFERMQIIPNKAFEKLEKKSDILIFHYGHINLDIKTFSKSVVKYAEKHKYDYINTTDISVWQSLYSVFQKYKYEYVLIIPANVYIKNTQHDLETLIQQAGDVDMILCRSETNYDQPNTDVILFRYSDWSLYKIHQLYYHEQELDTEIILDQIYTTHQHKTLSEFREYLDLGIPYILSTICVYHEHAMVSRYSDFMRYYDRLIKEEKKTEKFFPWGTIQHPRLFMIPQNPKPDKEIQVDKIGQIPKIIFQTMETNLTMFHVKGCIDQLVELNPGFNYYYYNSYECRAFIRKHFPEKVLKAYDTLIPGAYKADLWRYCVLYIHGGFYMDCRMFPYTSFESVITDKTEFMTCIDVTPNMAYQAILGSVPKSPVLKYAIDKCVEHIEQDKKDTGDLGVTGPKVIGMAINHWLKRTVHENLNTITDPKVTLLHWNSTKSPKYVESDKEIFCCHKYTKLLTHEEVDEETRYWMMLTGKQHYSVCYRKGILYKYPLLQES
jgi:mannosyltransferase OCH1-like enzyme